MPVAHFGMIGCRIHTRLDAQSAHPHLGRLSLSGHALHHVTQWNVGLSIHVIAGLRGARITYSPSIATVFSDGSMGLVASR
jgi:hypothetical protein